MKYVKPHSIIWCPFDTEESNFVKLFKEGGHKVIHSHISERKDFLKCNVKSHIDYVISNPPYSIRDKILTKLYSLNISFAMLMNSNGLFDSKIRIELGVNNGCELLYLYPRVKFICKDGKKMPPFQSVYFCHNILPETLMFDIRSDK